MPAVKGKCPKCGKPLKTVRHNGISLKECDACGYQINMSTGKVSYTTKNTSSLLVRCPSCQGKLRISDGAPGMTTECSYCGTEFTIPHKPDPDLAMVVTCPYCEGKNRVKANRGKLSVKCGHCNEKFTYDSGTWPAVNVRKKPVDEVTFDSETNKWILYCPICGEKLKVTAGSGITEVTDPGCGNNFFFDCDEGRHLKPAADGSYDGQWLVHCPDCKDLWILEKGKGVRRFDCSCGQTLVFNTDTGEPATGTAEGTTYNAKTNEWETRCPVCGKMVLVDKVSSLQWVEHEDCGSIWYFNGETGEHLPKAADGSVAGVWVHHCPQCMQMWTMEKGSGIIQVDCDCGSSWCYDANKGRPISTGASAGQQRPQQGSESPRPQSKPQPQQPQPRQQGAPCRTITIERATHAYKEWDIHGLENAFRDKWIVRIVLDDVEQGHLNANEPMTLNIDSGEHTIRYNLLAPRYRIPAGTDNYMVSYFRDNFRIGPETDAFRDGLTQFVVKMFRGRGIKDRILDPNNYGNKVYLDINREGIRVYWTLAHTKGLKQFFSGEGEDKISYRQMGLTPLAEEKQPTGYWEFLQMWVEEAILQDKEADMDKSGGGFTFRSKHDLF